MRSTRHFSLRYQVLFVLAVILLLSSSSLAQQAARPERGVMPNRSYSLTDIESINLQNGNVNLSIPLASLPPIAGGKLSIDLTGATKSQINAIKEYVGTLTREQQAKIIYTQ